MSPQRLTLYVLRLLFVPLITPQPFASAILFNFTSFNQVQAYTCSNDMQGICFDGDAFVDSVGAIQLTKGSSSAGWAYFSQPLLLWNRTTKELASFTSNFSFTVNIGGSNYSNISGGMTFFLFPPGSKVQLHSDGADLGLLDNSKPTNAFVAVEFDSFNSSQYDASNTMCHLGIDVNTLRSVATVDMGRNVFTQGPIGEARVAYDSYTKNLSLFLNFNETVYVLSHEIDFSLFLPERVSVGFSGSTLDALDMKRILSWSLNSSLDDRSNAWENKTTRPYPPDGWKMRNVVLGVAIGVVLVVVLLVLVWFFAFRLRRKRGKKDTDYDAPNASTIMDVQAGPQRFPFHILSAATANFRDEWKLGKGGFGSVYRGFLDHLNRDVAIKRIAQDSTQGKEEFVAEVKIISQLRHRNLVQLIGWCQERGELIVVYELMPNGSLDSHLFNADRILPWPQRYDIALGVASSLLYLHEEWDQCIVHRDIKSSNVMLDHSFNAKLGDFGLARIHAHGADLQTTRLAGTMGYMAPECFITGKATKESDVYSFGVVALEIASGRKVIEPDEEEEKIGLVHWARKLYGKVAILEAADKKLQMNFDVLQMERLMLVGLWCTLPETDGRPSIRQVRNALNFEAAVPDLHQKMPLPR